MATSALRAQNFFSTTLSSSISAAGTTIPLNSVPSNAEGYLIIEPDNSTNREIIYFTSKTASAVVCPSAAAGRGQDGTSAVSHSAGASVKMTFVNAYWDALRDGTALADGGVTPAKMALTKTTDANGWTKYDYGTFQQYRKKGSTSTTVTAGNWKYHTLSSNLPVGMASIGTNFVEAAVTVSDAACSATLGAGSSETSISVALSNQFSGGSITPTISWSICITTP